MRIIFAGTPEFSVPPLRALLGSGHRVIAVYTQPDRPAGRGRKLTPGPVKALALEAGVPVHQPLNFKAEQDLAAVESLGADLMVVVAYGLLLPQRVLDAPRLGCINIHASLLPRWRGAAPIQRAIAAGDRETGISIMQMEAGLDTGPMHLVRSCPIGERETDESLHDKLSALGAEALMASLPCIEAGTSPPLPQDDALATYAHKLKKEESLIDWRLPAHRIDQLVRAYNPWPVAQTSCGEAVLRIWDAVALDARGAEGVAGAVVASGPAGIDVMTGQGLLRITRLQMPGKRAMEAADFLNAHSVEGLVLG
ncbi:MAG: methionyl-tRNA formyltransferase [Gammaproteobacteria bacterium]|nr:methionyl-tRNA formyltransferase [Gammaproteobacteria bacterium]MBU1656323.1 methionyl-tRNA formyltransferase [Gammaproteobacteria bacterium]MBU1959888.1 methionyl-tRNA formyltransferase [Gammaproteobacteria bacterium]